MVNMKIPTKVIRDLDDNAVARMIPSEILAMLGDSEGSGYNLNTDQRDLFFSRGVATYKVGAADIEIEIDD